MKGITKWCKGSANATFLQNEKGYRNWCKVPEEMVHGGRKCTKVRKPLKWDIENKVPKRKIEEESKYTKCKNHYMKRDIARNVAK